MKIAILGTGNVGNALAKGLGKAGYEVCFGSRNPTKAKTVEGCETFSQKEAVENSDVGKF